MKFIKIKSKHAQGILQPNSFRKYPFQRFPEKYKNELRKEVWDLSKNSAGVTISFISNTSNLTARWTLKNQFKMHHMTDVGTSGIDLYQKKNNEWYFLNSGIPTNLNNEENLFKGLQKQLRHYRIHLPLYNTLTELELGIDSGSYMKITNEESPPLIFYGTSITQGGCASRPGLAYTNIISRKLNRICINLGFSGNGHLEESIGKILSKLQSATFIIDCMWNIDKKLIINNTELFLNALRSKNGNWNSPIIFYEQYLSNPNHPDKKYINSIIEKNFSLEQEIENKINQGFKNLHLIKQDGCIDKDTEATVDGIHFNDLGFERYANHFIDKFRELKYEL